MSLKTILILIPLLPLAAAAIALEDAGDSRTIRYLTQFLGGVARSVQDTPLAKAVEELANLQTSGKSMQSQLARVARMVQDRIARVPAI